MRKLLLLLLFLQALMVPVMGDNITVDNIQRNYIVYAPSNLGDHRPLLISCHGMNQDAAYQKGMLQIESIADTAKFVTVFPNGINKGWDISGNRDINFVLALIDAMVDRYNIDRNRVYLSGFSMGGMFTYHAMNRIADKIAAFAPISGYPMGGTTASASVRPIPIIHTHGTSDDVVAFSGVQGALNAWITHNGCPQQASVQTNYRGASHITRRTWGPGNNNVEVVLMELAGKGHWIANDVIKSGEEIWKFCKRFSLEMKDPSVKITAPKDGLTYLTIGGASEVPDIQVTATASDPDGQVVKVEFYDNNTLLKEFTSTPYSYTLTGLTKGDHKIKAVVTDDEGRTGSSMVTIHVEEPTPTSNYLLHKTFNTEGSVPEGWTTFDGNEQRAGFSAGYSSGSRVFRFTGSQHDFEWGLYTRNVTGDAKAGYARFADKQTSVTMTLYPGNYQIYHRLANWNIADLSPVTIAIETIDGQTVFSRKVTPTANIGNSASNSFSGTTLENFTFNIYKKGRYVITFYTADAAWADLVVGLASIRRLGDVTEDGTSGPGVKPLPTLHVQGKWLVDEHDNHVVLHGVMDTPSAYFNGGRWGWSYDDAGRQRCLEYFEKIFTGLEKAKCNVFRLHLEPAWTNDPNKQETGTETGEANISRFSATRLNNYLKTLYFPLIKKAMNHGMYVVVRPPGVCPGDLQVGDYYQDYLLTVWNVFTKNDSIRKYAGQISIEMANEPVRLKNIEGKDDAKALHDYFQPVVEKIRGNGFTGIIWAPGTGWQSNYTGYAQYPIEGYNIGYAVHDYTGWYGCSDDNPDPQNKINNFHNQVPVVDFAPVIITEVDWSPENPNAQGHYNEHGQWVQPNYGTWSTGSTSKWGKAYKTMLDHFGNISMTLSGTACLIDIDELINNNNVVPAFGGLEEACGKACMDWYAEYYNVDWPHADDEPDSDKALTAVKLSEMKDVNVIIGGYNVMDFIATYADNHTRNVTPMVTYDASTAGVATFKNGQVTGVKEGLTAVTANYKDKKGNVVQSTFNVNSTFFPYEARFVNPYIVGFGKYNEQSRAMRPAADGQVGWQYPAAVNMSNYKYLVVKLKQKQTCNAHLNIYTTAAGTAGDCYSSPDFGDDTQIVISLNDVKYNDGGSKNGRALNTKNVYTVSFWGNGNGIIVLKEIFLTNDESYAPVPEPVEGDVNGDSKVGIGDIVSVTNFMADGEASGVTLEQADVNGDGKVGIGDIISITNIMSGNK